MLDHTYRGTPVAQLSTAEIEELLASDALGDVSTGDRLSQELEAQVRDRLKLELEIRAMGLR